MPNRTLTYYNTYAYSFACTTMNVDFTATQIRFLSYLPSNAIILDFGCGSGRDTKFFLNRGYRVDAIDGSKELCKIASEYTGIEVKQQLFSELNVQEVYDGIWACSSILHLSKSELKDVFIKILRALKPDGWIYTSFKLGTFEGMRNERYFTDFTIDTFRDFARQIEHLKIQEYWITGDVRTERGDEKWLNLILQKD